MPDSALSAWVADMATKHNLSSSSSAPGGGGTATATAPPAAGGSGAKGQADAAEAAAGQAAAVAAALKPLATEIQTAALDAQKHKQEAATAKASVDQAVQGIAAPPPVPAPQGADPKGKYDAAIQISGKLRKAQQDASAKVADARNQELAAKTALTSAGGKAKQASAKAARLETQAQQAKGHAQTAAQAAKQAAAEAAKSKAAADKAADDDPNKATLQQTAQEDAKHAARAKGAAAKAVASAKQATGSAAAAGAQAKSAGTAQQGAQQTADGVGQSVGGLDAKLAPFEQAVSQAEAQEAECKNGLSAEDAQAVLEQRYEELGGDGELTKVLAAEDKEYQAATEAFRARIEDYKKDRTRELDEQKAKMKKTADVGLEVEAAFEGWHERESNYLSSAQGRANDLDAEKKKTEPGKEACHLISLETAKIDEVAKVLEYNRTMLEETEKLGKTLETRYEDLKAAHDAGEQYATTVGTELDNELQMSGMTLEQKVDFLQTKPKPVRDRIQKQLETYLNQLLAGSIADTQAETATFSPEEKQSEPDAIDWDTIHIKLDDVELASLEELQGKDPKLAKLEEEYESAGGDAALLEKRLAAWKTEVAEREKQVKQAADEYRKDSAELQSQVEAVGEKAETSEGVISAQREEIRADQARLEELMNKMDPVTGDGRSEREQAEMELCMRRIEANQMKVSSRENMLAAQNAAKDTAAQQLDQHKDRHDAMSDDDVYPMPVKPESADIDQLPIKAKYTELTGKSAPA